MEAWGIIITAFTMFGMLVLTVASVTTDAGFSEAQEPEHESIAEADELKKAA